MFLEQNDQNGRFGYYKDLTQVYRLKEKTCLFAGMKKVFKPKIC